MLTDIKRKDNKIFVTITLEKYGPENPKKQKYYRSSVETFLTERGLQPGTCIQNSVIHNLDESSLSGNWVFEDLDIVEARPLKKTKKTTSIE